MNLVNCVWGFDVLLSFTKNIRGCASMISKIVTACMCLLFTVSALQAGRPSRWNHAYSLTLSPYQLTFPIVRTVMEFRTGDDHAVGVIAELGEPSGTLTWGLG